MSASVRSWRLRLAVWLALRQLRTAEKMMAVILPALPPDRRARAEWAWRELTYALSGEPAGGRPHA